jgi:hypothetical protein
MKKKLLLIFTMVGFVICLANAQNTDAFKPSGSPEVLIFTDFNNTTTNGKSLSKFEITRAYFGYKYNFSQTFSGRVTFDVGNPGVGALNYTAYIKYGYLQYQEKNLTVKFGLIGTNGYSDQEKFWGNRYILKSFQDQYGMGPSADFGISAAYGFNEIISADAIIENGEGYKGFEVDSVLKVGVGVTIHPVKELTIRGYYDNMAKNSVAQQTTAFMVGYANKSFNLAVEYNAQSNNKYKSGYNFSGYSVYGTLSFNAKTGIVARYDALSSKDITTNEHSWNFSKDGSQFILGFQYVPVKGVRISPNYQLWTPKDGSKTSTSSLFLNVEIKI